LDDLREKSDSESFDDEKERLNNIKKAMLVDQLREQLKNSDQEKSQIINDTNTNIERLESNLEFSTKANVIQREDYDLLQ